MPDFSWGLFSYINFAPFLKTFESFIGHNHSIYSTFSIPSKMVVKPSYHFQGSLITSQLIRSHNNHRCLQENVWRASCEPIFSGNMVIRSYWLAHKFSRNGSCLFNSQSLSRSDSRKISVDQNRQYNDCTIYKQTRGNKIKPTLHSDMEIMDISYSKQHFIEGTQNILADELSRHKIRATEWSLNAFVVQKFF